jgi:hypothetical protein
MPSKPKIVRQTVESIPGEETVSSVFSDKPGKNTKGKKTSSPKSNMATVGSESIPEEETVSSVFSDKPVGKIVKGRKKSPTSDKATVGSESSSISSASDSSSDVDSSIEGIPGASIRSVGAPDTEEIEEWENLNILTPYNKSQDKFQDMLASLTRSDAHHDLKKVFNETAYKERGIKTAFDNGIPKPADVSFHEGEAFAAVIRSAADAQGTSIEINGSEDKLLEALLAVPNCTDSYTGYSVFNVGVTDMNLFKYKVVKFITECSNNAEFKNEKENLVNLSCKSDFGKRFVENTKLGEDNTEAAIIVDFGQHHFMEYLTLGEESQFQIHYLMTPEVVNDPAGKPNVNNKSLFGPKNTGVKLISYVEETDSSTAYTKFDESDPSPANNFFSKYDFTLSPIKKIITNQKAEKFITTLDIKYDVPKGLPLTDTIEDSKDENSIKQVLSYLKTLMDEVRVSIDNATTFNFNSKIQQKRGGDWFQALSCIDARNRLITQVLPTPATKPIKLPPTCPVYLVTHDRIAVTYALLNGVNVIYSDYYGRIFVFKNSSDKTLKGSGKSMENILFDGIKEKWMSDEQSHNEFLRMIGTAKKYSEDRNKYLNVGRGTEATGGKGKIKDFYNKCDTIKASLEALDFSGKNPIIDFQKVCTSNLRELFTAAVELTFIKINLINIDRDISIVESEQNLFTGEYNEDISRQVADFSKALNNIKGIQDKFGVIPKDSDFVLAFDNWINGNIPKLDVYKCAKKILDDFSGSEESVSFDFNRLISFFTKDHKQERKTDANIFLPFIQDIEYTDRETTCKNKMLTVLSTIIPKIEQYISLVKSNTSSRASRSGNLGPNELYYNNLSNLIYESYIFIENTIIPVPSESSSSAAANEPSSPPVEVQKVQSLIEISKSTDNILLKSDKDELDLMNGAGKISNYSGNSEDSIDEDESESKVYNLKCIVKGDSITCNGTAEGVIAKGTMEGKELGGGGYIDSYAFPTKIGAPIKTESVICDISLKQINWPLLTCNLIEKTDISSLMRFSQQIRSYITGLDKPENTELLALIQSKVQATRDSALISEFENATTSSVVIDLKSLADGLQKIGGRKGGANGESDELPTISKDLMTDFKLGFHPLTPIYSILTSYYNIIGEKSQSDPFFYTYFTYINILEKMKKVIEENYLSNTINSLKTSSAYMIGFGLYFMIFASHTSLLQNDEILSVIQMSQKEYSDFSLKNDGLVSLFSGAIHQTPQDELIGMVLVNNELFNNFINNEVNIKQILQQGTSVVNLPTYDVLQERMFKLMGEIVVKVNADRGTPITSSPTASGIPGISSEERASRAALGQKQYEENVAKGLINPQKKTGIVDSKGIFTNSSEGILTTSSQGTRTLGGKMRKRKITRRHRNKIYKNKTIKRSKKNKKTIKHRNR